MLYIILTLFLKPTEEQVLQEIQDHKTPATNQRISKYASTNIGKEKKNERKQEIKSAESSLKEENEKHIVGT